MILFGLVSALPLPSALSSVRCTLLDVARRIEHTGLGFVGQREGRDHRGMMLGLERSQICERRRQRAGNAARFAQVALGNAADDRLASRP